MKVSNLNTCGRETPCAECPFARHVTPGKLGGSPIEVYIGQAYGPFYLPWHSDYEPDSRERFDKGGAQVRQCAGAAIFRSNIGVAELMPDGMHQLPKDTEKVFATRGEFIAHHSEVGTPLIWDMLVDAGQVAQMVQDAMREARRKALAADIEPAY